MEYTFNAIKSNVMKMMNMINIIRKIFFILFNELIDGVSNFLNNQLSRLIMFFFEKKMID